MTRIPGSVATTDTISIHCGLSFIAATINGKVKETASSQETCVAHRTNSGGMTQRNGREAVQISEMQAV